MGGSSRLQNGVNQLSFFFCGLGLRHEWVVVREGGGGDGFQQSAPAVLTMTCFVPSPSRFTSRPTRVRAAEHASHARWGTATTGCGREDVAGRVVA